MDRFFVSMFLEVQWRSCHWPLYPLEPAGTGESDETQQDTLFSLAKFLVSRLYTVVTRAKLPLRALAARDYGVPSR